MSLREECIGIIDQNFQKLKKSVNITENIWVQLQIDFWWREICKNLFILSTDASTPRTLAVKINSLLQKHKDATLSAWSVVLPEIIEDLEQLITEINNKLNPKAHSEPS